LLKVRCVRFSTLTANSEKVLRIHSKLKKWENQRKEAQSHKKNEGVAVGWNVKAVGGKKGQPHGGDVKTQTRGRGTRRPGLGLFGENNPSGAKLSETRDGWRNAKNLSVFVDPEVEKSYVRR